MQQGPFVTETIWNGEELREVLPFLEGVSKRLWPLIIYSRIPGPLCTAWPWPHQDRVVSALGLLNATQILVNNGHGAKHGENSLVESDEHGA